MKLQRKHFRLAGIADLARLMVIGQGGASPAVGAPPTSVALRDLLPCARQGAPLNEVQRRWLAAGYAVVNADVRGTGASFGQWYIPYSPQEARDLGFLTKWIARQPWSNGAVVMTGTSYPGTTPLLATAYGSPAIKAVAPKFSDFDLYSDPLWPGGVAAEELIVKWGKLVRGLDLNQPEDDDGASPRSSGVRPIDGPDGEKLLLQAIAAHKRNPWSFDRAVHEVTFRDQRSGHMHGMSIEDGDVSTLDARIERSGVPIFGWGSWLDSGIAQGLLNRFMTLRNPQLTIIGPWTHGARANANVFEPNAPLEPPPSIQDQWNYCFLNNYASKVGDPIPSHRRLRLAVAGADKGTFVPIPTDNQDVTVQVSHGGGRPSFIDVPEVP
jgi:putative CocE/NonD family hydrolase